MKTSELIKMLKAHGCVLKHHGSNHDVWISQNNNLIIIPRHSSKEIPKGTAESILKQAGIKEK